MKTIVLIVLQLSQPRCIKRISTLKEAGIPVKVYGFDSGLYNESLKSLPFDITEIIQRNKNVGRFHKISFFAATIKRILKENKSNSIFYLFGFEITSIAYLLGCRNYIYEEADVTASRIKNKAIKKIMLAYDRLLYKNAHLVVSTSEGFIKYLYPDKEIPNNIIFLPNKLSTFFNDKLRQSVQTNKVDISHIKFGFVGLIRYPNTIIRFAKVIGRNYPQHEFHFYGQPENPKIIDNEIKSYNNIFFHGQFTNPQDLQLIYEAIDINIVCYDTTSDNVRIAEPNKLYESIFFNTPIVVSRNTFLAERVKQYGAGYVINSSIDEDIQSFVDNISSDDFATIKGNMLKVSTKELIDNSDAAIKRITMSCLS